MFNDNIGSVLPDTFIPYFQLNMKAIPPLPI